MSRDAFALILTGCLPVVNCYRLTTPRQVRFRPCTKRVPCPRDSDSKEGTHVPHHPVHTARPARARPEHGRRLPRHRAVGPQLGRSSLPSVLLSQRAPKEEPMSRNAMYAKFVLLVLVLSTVAVFLGIEPWGPN